MITLSVLNDTYVYMSATELVLLIIMFCFLVGFLTLWFERLYAEEKEKKEYLMKREMEIEEQLKKIKES